MTNKSRTQLFTAERQLQAHGGTFTSAAGSAMDTQVILDAINELKAAVQQGSADTHKIVEEMPEMTVLRGQLFEMKESIEKTKQEIAAVRHPGSEEDRFSSAALELDAIVGATERATHNILNASEDIEDKVRELKERVGSDVGAAKLLDDISALGINILENCNFQDITGQRTSKVVKTIHYLEERIMAMIGIWGAEEFAGIEVEKKETGGDVLEGPQSDGAGVSQDDIDSLFD